MQPIDPLRHPHNFIQQADALIRQSLAEPGGPDPFAVIDAQLEASFDAVLERMAHPEAVEAETPAKEAKAEPAEHHVARQLPMGLPAVNPYAYGMGLPMMPYGGMGAMGGMPMMPYGMLPGMGGRENAGLPMMMPMLPPMPRAQATTSALPASRLDPVIDQLSARYQVPSWLIKSVMRAESGGDPLATSPVGAMGLMQLMPQTAHEMGVGDPYDPGQNLEGGVKYLRRLLDTFGGDVTKAVAAYNAGPGSVQKYDGVPPFAETQAYVRRVLG